MKHNCRLDGTAATAADLAQARAWSSKIPADRTQYYKSKEFVSSESDDSDSESSERSSSRRDSPSPPRQVKKAKRELSESPPRRSVTLSKSSSPPKSAPPKVCKVRFEVDEPVSERGETSRARKRPVKTAPSSPEAAAMVSSILELEVAEPEPRKFVKARRSKKDTAAVRSEVHTVKPPVTKKKATKSSAVPEAQDKVATPRKELVIETPRLETMVQVAKQAVQNLKDRKELQIPDPSVYRPHVRACFEVTQAQSSQRQEQVDGQRQSHSDSDSVG